MPTVNMHGATPVPIPFFPFPSTQRPAPRTLIEIRFPGRSDWPMQEPTYERPMAHLSLRDVEELLLVRVGPSADQENCHLQADAYWDDATQSTAAIRIQEDFPLGS